MDIKRVGNEIQLAGCLFNDDRDGASYIILLPDEDFHPIPYLERFNVEKWKEFLWQSDVLETEVKTKEGKAIIRKAQRQIADYISWNVYKRDEYTCRYCGREYLPLTVDHIVLWEDGGPSIEENLVASCKRCNRTRGNMKYPDWIASEKYKSLSGGVDKYFLQENEKLIEKMKDIPVSDVKLRGKKR